MVTSNSWQRILATVGSPEWANKKLEVHDQFAIAGKRLLDVVVALIGLILAMPLMLAIAVAVKLDSRGPVLYISRRLGRNGRVFHCIKFRTMTGNHRVTRVGWLLRRYSLDELPQLINVICGDMSIVGPRPVMASDGPSEAVSRFRRLEMTPGMTGLWAVQEVDYSPLASYVSPDDAYRRKRSVWLDLAIMLRSLAAALAGRGH